MYTKDSELLEAMSTYGGSFVKSLAKTLSLADPINYNKLCKAVPEVIRHYTAIKNLNPKTENARPH